MNESKFNFKGNVYSKGRPNYPDALFNHLISNNIIDHDTVAADVGSGTGKFTVQLSKYVHTVYAIEPNDDMRSEGEVIYVNHNNIISLNSTAEAIALPDRSIDVITSAQAFHWFNRTLFKTECKRILKPNGKVILVWNDRDNTSEIIKDNFDVNKKYCPNFKGSSNGMDFSKESFKDFFNNCEIIEFRQTFNYSITDFILRNLSSSYAPLNNDKHYNDYINALEKLFDKYGSNGTVAYPYITRCYIGTV